MFGVKYSHRWTVPLPKKDVWNLFHTAFEDSNQIPQWPTHLNSIKYKTEQSEPNPALGHLHAKGPLEVTYKIFGMNFKEPYIIQQVIPEQRIVYDTAEDHPLEGQSEIDLKDAPDGTEVTWQGFYNPKSFSSLVSIAYFKFYFENAFFREFEELTHNATRLHKTKHRLNVETREEELSPSSQQSQQFNKSKGFQGSKDSKKSSKSAKPSVIETVIDHIPLTTRVKAVLKEKQSTGKTA